MRLARRPVVFAVGVAVLAAPASAAVVAAEDTHPRVAPDRGTRHSRFAASLTLRRRAGQQGVLETTYRVSVRAPRGARPACAPRYEPVVREGQAGQRKRVHLPVPPHGWCVGRYRVAVTRVSGPYCPPPAAGQPAPPCPAFVTRVVAAGATSFTVVSR